MVQEAKEPKTNDEREEENSSQSLIIASEKPAESEAGEEEPEVEEPSKTASPKTPLVVLKKGENGEPEVEVNPNPEAPTKDAPAESATSSSPSVTPTVTPTVKPAPADESKEENAPESKPAITASGKTVNAADAPVTSNDALKDPEVEAAKSEKATPEADVKKIKAVSESATNSDGEEKKKAVVKKVVKKAEVVAQEAVKEVEKILKDTELAVEKAKPIIPNKCFYIQSLGANGEGTNLYYEVDQKDKYHPRKTGAYNVDLHKGIAGSHEERKAQQWFYDDKTFALHSAFFPKKVLFEGYNKNLIMFGQRNLPNQQFIYDHINQVWQNKKSRNAISMPKGAAFESGSELITRKLDELPDQKFKIIYCDEV